MISLVVAAAGWVGVSSPGDYAVVQFPPLPRHDLRIGGETIPPEQREAFVREFEAALGRAPTPEEVIDGLA